MIGCVQGEGKDAEKLFATMEEIYNAIYPFAVYDNIVSGYVRNSMLQDVD